MIGRTFFGATITARDMRFMKFVMPLTWVLLAYATCLAVMAGNVGASVSQIGLMIVLFCAMIGPHFFCIIDPAKDVALGKLSTVATLLGFLIMVTGFLVRLSK